MKIIQLILAGFATASFCSAFAAEKIAIDIQGYRETVAKLGKLTSVKKDKFEKTTGFTKRLCEQTYKALGISEKTLITIGLEHTPTYNADKQVFIIFEYVVGGNHFKAGDGFNDRFLWNTSFDPSKYNSSDIAEESLEAPGTYSGRNAFGVSKEVKVRAENAAVFYFPTKKNNDKIVFPSKPEDARKIAKELRIAVVTRVQPPCFVSGKGHKSPTMDYPYDLTLSEIGIVGAPNPEWVLYLNSTKEILKRGKFH